MITEGLFRSVLYQKTCCGYSLEQGEAILMSTHNYLFMEK